MTPRASTQNYQQGRLTEPLNLRPQRNKRTLQHLTIP